MPLFLPRRRLLQGAFAGALASLVPPALAIPGLRPGMDADQAMRGLDLSGRAIMVTGCNSGIGLEVMRERT